MAKKSLMLCLSVLVVGGLVPIAQAQVYDTISDGAIFQDPNDVDIPVFPPNPSAYSYDPNKFQIDNPHWQPAPLYVEPASARIAAAYGRLRCSGEEFIFPDLDVVYMGAVVMDDDTDPNTSPRVFDNSGSCYFVVNVRSHDDNWDPGNGMIGAWILGDMLGNQTSYDFEMQLNEGWSAIRTYWGPQWIDLDDAQPYDEGYPEYLWHPDSTFDPNVDPNWWGNPGHPTYDPNFVDPNYGGYTSYKNYKKATIEPMDPMEIRWMLVQYDVNGANHDPNFPNDPADPNCHWVRGAAWVGGKYDWDGRYVLEVNIIGNMIGEKVNNEVGDDYYWDPNDPNHWIFLQTEGFVSVSAYSGGNATQDPAGEYYVVDTSYDEMEARWGFFDGSSHTLELSVLNATKGIVEIHPDLFDDPNNQPYFLHWAEYGDPNDPNFDWLDASTWSDANDPNNWVGTYPPDPNELRRYTPGTEVMLVATPTEGTFDRWKIFDPNYPGDDNYATIDSNTVIYLTMDGDYVVEASFKCGSGLPPFVAMSLLALGLGVAIRRFS